jgi:signal peptide peptidase SppA
MKTVDINNILTSAAHGEWWAGDEASWQKYSSLQQKYATIVNPEIGGVVIVDGQPITPGVESTTKRPVSRLLQIQDDIALFSVNGILTNQDNWWNKYEGLVSYSEIVAAAHELIADVSVTDVILDVESPGGAVAGVRDAVDAMVLLRGQKRITSFSGAQAQSAGQWLHATGAKRFAGASAFMGSVGVIYKHIEYTKAMEKFGATPTVIRSGEFKQLANESEVLSDKAKKEMQGRSDHIYELFTSSMAELLDKPHQLVKNNMAEGKTFIGQQAMDVGLVHGIASFDEVYLAVAKGAARRKQKAGGISPMSKKMSVAALAALSAGVDLPPEGAAAPTPEGAGETLPEKPESSGAPAEETLPAGETSQAILETNSLSVAELAGQITLLSSQMKELRAENTALSVKCAGLETREAALAAQVGPLKTIVARGINAMAVAINSVADASLEQLDASALVARHEATSKMLVERFPGAQVRLRVLRQSAPFPGRARKQKKE